MCVYLLNTKGKPSINPISIIQTPCSPAQECRRRSVPITNANMKSCGACLQSDRQRQGEVLEQDAPLLEEPARERPAQEPGASVSQAPGADAGGGAGDPRDDEGLQEAVRRPPLELLQHRVRAQLQRRPGGR